MATEDTAHILKTRISSFEPGSASRGRGSEAGPAHREARGGRAALGALGQQQGLGLSQQRVSPEKNHLRPPWPCAGNLWWTFASQLMYLNIEITLCGPQGTVL